MPFLENHFKSQSQLTLKGDCRLCLFGLMIHCYPNMDTLLFDLKKKLLSEKKLQIVTLNPEMFVDAQKDEEFKNILKKSLVIPDGIGISLAGKIFTHYWCNRFPGVDILLAVLKSDLFRNYSFYFFGASEKSVGNLIKKIKDRFPFIKIAGFHPGEIEEIYRLKNAKVYEVGHRKNYATPDLAKKISDSEAEILFVALGSPLQEKWIYHNLKELGSVKLAIGVGGAFDMISGQTPRAPLFLRKIGLEWFWRLILQPSRIKRIYKATVIFTFLIFKKLWQRK